VPELYGSVGVLYHRASGKVLLHHRDGKAPHYANLWAGFGGLGEPEDGGDPVATWQREMREELGIELRREQIVPLREYISPHSGRPRYIFYVLWPTLDTEHFVLGEGDGFGWFRWIRPSSCQTCWTWPATTWWRCARSSASRSVPSPPGPLSRCAGEGEPVIAGQKPERYPSGSYGRGLRRA